MRVLTSSNCVAITAFAGILLTSATPASANIQYTNFLVANDVNVTLTCNSVPNCTSGYYGSGQIDLYDNGSTPVATIWCIDVTHDLQGPWSSAPGSTTYTFNVTHWKNMGGGLSNIWSGGASGIGTQLTNKVVGELGALAYYGDTNISTANVSPAVQLAIWDVEYNGGALTLDGNLKEVSDSSQVQSLAELLVSDVEHGKLGHDLNVNWLTCGSRVGGACNQGQLQVGAPPSVPEPNSLWIFGSGLLGLAGIFGFRRRRENSAPLS